MDACFAACDETKTAGLFTALIGSAPPFVAARRHALVLAARAVHVLIIAAPGAGARSFARLIHEASARHGALVILDCSRGSTSELAAALQRGLQVADNGTLMVRELQLLPPELRQELAELYDNWPVKRCQLIATTSAPQPFEAMRSAWRSAAGSVLRVPPLRHRPLDIVQLARHFMSELRGACSTAMDVAALAGLPWRHNVAELRSTIYDSHARAMPTDVLPLWSDPSAREHALANAMRRVYGQLGCHRAVADALCIPWIDYVQLGWRYRLPEF